MTQTITWITDDKTSWGPGPWQDEPDKIQWTDPTTGLPCLVVRGPVGALCGYTGVSQGHPFFRHKYNDCVLPGPCPDRTKAWSWCDHTPEHFLEAHGGITFSGPCADLSESAWKQAIESFHSDRIKAEARRYPKGDSARWLQGLAPVIGSFPQWQEHQMARAICHKPEPGAPAEVWWFGFDCAHAGDFSPKSEAVLKQSYSPLEYAKHKAVLGLGVATGWGEVITYRDLAYTKAQVSALAQQLFEKASSQ